MQLALTLLLSALMAGSAGADQGPKVDLAVSTQSPTTWPTPHNDYQRSGYTDEVLKGPFSRKWYRDFHDEMIATRYEAIVAEGKVYIGTFKGKFRALEVVDGKTVWTTDLAGPIGASPSYVGGRLYVGCDESFRSGWVYCIRASDGEVIWKQNVGAGVWGNPVVADGKVYLGDRGGIVHALDASNGQSLWTYETGGMILKAPSMSKDGKKIVIGSEDMYVHCLGPEGNLIWKSPKLPGVSMRDQGPTIWQDMVVVRTSPVDSFHGVLQRQGEVLEAIQRKIPLNEADKVLLDKWGDYMLHPTPRRREAEWAGIVEYLKEKLYEQSFHTLELATGKLKRISPIFYTAGLHNPPTPPTFNPNTGELYTICRTALTYYVRGVRRYAGICRLDPDTGMGTWFFPGERHDKERMWYAIPLIGDETSAVSLMGNNLVVTHQGDIGMIDLEKNTATRIWNGRDTYGGIFGFPPAGGWEEGEKKQAEGWLITMPNEWHGPDRAIVAIAEGRMFWVVGSQVVCLGGKDVPITPTGGEDAPELTRYRLPIITVAEGETRDDVSVKLNGQRVRQLVLEEDSVRPVQSDPVLTSSLRNRLDAQVLELIRQGPWAPLAIQLGISGSDIYYQRTAVTMQIVAQALPYLSPAVAEQAQAYLHQLHREGVPLDKPVWPGGQGKRRELYDMAPELHEAATRTLEYNARIDDVYALYAYAKATDSFNALSGKVAQMSKLLDGLDAEGYSFDPSGKANEASWYLNGEIGGLIGYARIMEKLGRQDRVQRALKLLEPRLEARIRLEKANRDIIRRRTRGLHYESIPRYRSLTPELAEILGNQAQQALTRNIDDLVTGLPLWYQAFGERMVGGENYMSPPNLSRGIFMALADGLKADPAAMARFLDQPWSKADLFYIEKIAAVFRNIN
jgi:hypothetical protein